MSDFIVTPHMLLDLLKAGSVELELWGDPGEAKLVGAGFKDEGYALVKVRDEAGREVIEIVSLSVIKEVRLSE
ncbi:hypothetical protein ACOI1A_00765 [Corynebacterium glutamicum]|uniref:hypothetical protein n=1 Tax=Corynebacterium glutamicum TaxID=1718 RepID=UPI003B5C04C4